ncbi:MAG: hypothetical protein K0R71_1683 [Bacillales bacterium]|jgi:hypothetical protein|nr:hypothetical protein [Bacillales bacterium]
MLSDTFSTSNPSSISTILSNTLPVFTWSYSLTPKKVTCLKRDFYKAIIPEWIEGIEHKIRESTGTDDEINKALITFGYLTTTQKTKDSRR